MLTDLTESGSGSSTSLHLGSFLTLAELQSTYPTAKAGNTADVDDLVTPIRYIWDTVGLAWAEQVGANTALTDLQVKTQNENNPNTNAFTDTEKDKVAKVSVSIPINLDIVLTDDDLKTAVSVSNKIITEEDLSGFAGDMNKSVFDPQGINADAFSTDNHTDGVTNKVYTAIEKTKLATMEENAKDDQTANEVIVSTVIGTPDASNTVEKLLSLVATAGVVKGGVLTKNFNSANPELSTVSIAISEVNLRTFSGDDLAPLIPAIIAETLDIPLTIDRTNYIYASYNAGVPLYEVTINQNDIDCQSKCLAYMVNLSALEMHIISDRQHGLDSSRKTRQVQKASLRFRHQEGGTAIGEAGDLGISLTAGNFFYTVTPLPHDAFDTSIIGTDYKNVFLLHTQDGLGGSNITQDQKVIDTTTYDNGGVITTFGNNKFGVSWVYIVNNTPSHLHVVMGQAEYATLAEAQKPTLPITPTLLQDMGVLVGYVVYEKGALNFNDIFTAFGTILNSATPTSHDGLSNISGGGIADYQHLTTAQLALVDGSMQKVASTDNAIVVYNGVTGDVKDSNVFIADSGNVGIGTANPSELLHIKSGVGSTDIGLEEDGSGWRIRNSITNNNFLLSSVTGAFDTFVDRFTILASNGNVGIGTATPIRRLDVEADSVDGLDYVAEFTNPSTGTSAVSGIRVSSGTITGYIKAYGVNHSTDPQLIQFAGTSGSSDFHLGSLAKGIRVLSSGYVGIGTSTPTNTLQIKGAGSDVAGEGQIRITNSTSENYAWGLRTGSHLGDGSDLHLDYYNGSWLTALTVERGSGNVEIINKLFVSGTEIKPTLLGSLLGSTVPTTIPLDLVTGTPLTNYESNIEIVTTADITTGKIRPAYDGTYRINISLHSVFDNVGGAGKKEIYFDLVDTTAGTTAKSLQGFILKDAETFNMTDNGAVQLIANHDYQMQIRSEIALTNFSFSSSTFYIESIIY